MSLRGHFYCPKQATEYLLNSCFATVHAVEFSPVRCLLFYYIFYIGRMNRLRRLSHQSLCRIFPMITWIEPGLLSPRASLIFYLIVIRRVPFLISWWLKPMVGIVSSSKEPSVIDLTRVVLPAFCSPTMAISSYLLKNLDLIQARNLSTNANIFYFDIFLLSCNT